MSYELNRKDNFVDITKGFSIRYNDYEMVDGHKFTHIYDGIFAAEPRFTISKDEFIKLTNNYQDIEFCAFIDGENFQIVFAYSIHYIPHFDESRKLNYIINSRNSALDSYFPKDMHPYDLEMFDYHSLLYKYGVISKDSLKESGALLQHYYYTDDAFSDNMVLTLDGVPGYLVEDGIYYFPEYNPIVSLNSEYEQEIAIIGGVTDNYHPCSTFYAEYAAVGREHFDRLYEILQELGVSSDLCYFELERTSCNPEDKQIKDIYIKNDDQYRRDRNEIKDNTDYYIPKDAVELIEGIGFTDITLRYSRPLLQDTPFREYKIAYIHENELYLIPDNYMSYGFEVHKLDYISRLYIRENRKLSCGITYPVIHRVIDEGEGKYKSIMKEEAYRNYVFESLQDEIVKLLQEVNGFEIETLAKTMQYVSKNNNRLQRLKEYLINNPEASSADVRLFVYDPDYADQERYTKEPLNFDLRKYSKYIREHNIKEDVPQSVIDESIIKK